MRRNHAAVAVVAAVAVLGFASAMVSLPTSVTITLGLALFVAPGYVWSEVLLSNHVTGLERLTVATGLALALPVFGGLLLYAAGVPLHRTVWVSFLSGVAILGAILLMIPQRPKKSASLTGRTPGASLPVRHAITFGVAIVIAIGAIALACVGADLQRYPAFTQLWLSPRNSTPLTADLGVSNQQGSRAQYRLVLLRRGHVSAIWNVTLGDGQTWQHTIPFSDRYSIVANLYRLPDLAHPYRNVTNGDGVP